MLQFWDLVQKTYIKKTFQIGSCLFNLHQMNSLILCIFFIASMLREMNSGSSITCDDHQKPSAQSEAVNQYCLHVGLHLVIPNSEFKRRALTAKEAAYFKKFNHDGIIGPGNNNNNNKYINNDNNNNGNNCKSYDNGLMHDNGKNKNKLNDEGLLDPL